MYCKKCGSRIEDGSRFCPVCGEKVEENEKSYHPYEEEIRNFDGMNINQGVESKKSKKKLWLPILAGVIVILLVIIALGAYVFSLNFKAKQVASQIDDAGIPEYIVKKDEVFEEWSGNVFSVPDKKEILKQLQSIEDQIANFGQCKKEVENLDHEKEKYALSQEEYEEYTHVLEKCKMAIKENHASDAISMAAEVKKSLEDLISANEEYIYEKLELYNSFDLADASDDVKIAYDANMEKLKNLDAAGENKNYTEYKTVFEEMDDATYMFIEPENYLDISVQQIDASGFPKVKVYMDVKDSAMGTVPDNLESSFFYINKEDANAQYIKEKVLGVSQLNEEEALNVNMVADVSGSMDGSPLREAKRIMSNFVNSVQFGVGDMVELTSFADGVHLEREFTSNANQLIHDINGLYTGNMTSLYDALYTAVARVAAQGGAKCVIGFTDGRDNNSSCSERDVIDLATRYHVPVFIIGIGDEDYTGAYTIAQQTGGEYYSVYEIYSMEEIYKKIYRKEKEMYVMEYEDTSGKAMTEQSDIQIGYRSKEYGGECNYSYVPNLLMSVDAMTFYTDGPEAVVERYMKNFDDAISNNDFSYIEDCLLPGSSIYGEQQAYVQKNIREQLDSYEIVSTDYSDPNNCVVTTRETYLVQIPGKPLKLMTQQCQYCVVNTGNEWKMTAFASPVQVLYKINQ